MVMTDKPYRWDAEGYAYHSSPQQEWAMELLAKLRLEGKERLLDIGCGDGKVTAEIAHLLSAGSIVAIDNSREMIQLARSNYPEDDFPNVRFHQIDARNLPFDNEFDVIFSNATLHWIEDHFPVLLGINRSLKPGGKVLLQMGGRGNGAGIIRAASKVTKARKWENYFADFSTPYAFYGPGQYQHWLKKAGLRPVRAELIPKMMIHDGPDDLMTWLEKVFIPYTEKVPKQKRRYFVEEVIEQYLENHPVDEKGRTYVHMVRLEIAATKDNA